MRTRVALLCGGRSQEHSISLISAANVLAAIDPEKFEVTVIGIAKDGGWKIISHPNFAIHDGVLPVVTDPTHNALQGPSLLNGHDVIFPLLHGVYGEDGAIQGLLESSGMRYVGSGVLASAMAMEKGAMKQILTSAQLATPDHVTFRLIDWASEPREVEAEILEHLQLPIFVKPSRAGSSQGVTKVKSASELGPAIELAGAHDSRIIVEQGVDAREIECAVLQDATGEILVSVPGEILVDKKFEFYDFDAKYIDGSTKLVIPADVSPELAREMQELAREAFIAMQCEGLARVDFFLTPDGPMLNEINTMPGFTSGSMYPLLWAASGIDYKTLITLLIEEALARPLTIFR